MIATVMFQYFGIDLDEEINQMLNTRFNNTQQKWLHSLQSMPIGVMIYNTSQKEVIFENSKLLDLLSGHGLKDKFAINLKSVIEEGGKQIKKQEALQKVISDLIADCRKGRGGQSLDDKREESDAEEDMQTFKIMHNKKKVGIQAQLLE